MLCACCSTPPCLHWAMVNSKEALICFAVLNQVKLPQNVLALILPSLLFFPPLLSRISFCRIIKLLTSALLWRDRISLFIKPTLPICHYDCKKKAGLLLAFLPTKALSILNFLPGKQCSQTLLLTTPLCIPMSTECDPSAASKAALWAMPGSFICSRLSSPAVTCCLEANKLGCVGCPTSFPAAQQPQL